MPQVPRSIDQCPKSADGTCDRQYYAKGLCKSCYNADQRAKADANYEATPEAKARKQRYELTEKGRSRKRKWWNNRQQQSDETDL
ncbi:MAG: hypothetical protein WCD18_14025 [Thermosynechococcaceae cyanobacterium]